MKQIDLTGVVLNPAARTLDFSALAIDPRTVLAVLHEPTNRFIFAAGRSGLGYASIAGAVMTLALDTTDLAAGPLTGFRDDGVDVATDARLEACRTLLATAAATQSNIATAVGTPSDVDPGSDVSAASIVALLRRGLGRWTTLLARIPVLVSGRIPVDGSGVTQPVSAAALPLPAGAAQDGADGPGANPGTGIRGWLSGIYARLGGTLTATLAAGANTIGAVSQSGTWAVNATLQAGSAVVGRAGIQVGGADVAAGNPVPVSAASLPLPTGAATSAAQATGNASLASLDGKAPAKGQAAMVASTPVAIASDQSPVSVDTVRAAASTSRSGTIAAGGTAQQLMAANASRRGFVVQNQSNGDLYVNSLGAATLDQNSLKIAPGDLYETPVHHVGAAAVSILGATTGQAFYAREF